MIGNGELGEPIALSGLERQKEAKAIRVLRTHRAALEETRRIVDWAFQLTQTEQGREALLGLNRALNALGEWEKTYEEF